MKPKGTKGNTATLKKVVITERPGFRGGIPFTFRGQLFEEMNERQQKLYLEGEFEPKAVTEFFEKEMRIPPLNFMILRNHGHLLDKITASMDANAFTAMIDLVLLALSRNYQGTPRWLVEQSLDFGTLPALTRAFMDASGLIERETTGGDDGKKAQGSP